MTRHPFDLLMELDEAEICLDCAALHVARDVYPDFDMQGCLVQLDRLAEEVARCQPGLAAATRFRAMREVLVEGFDLAGNEKDYYDPDNSYLNCVLERKLGIPISLSIVWIEVARRLNWPVAGVGLPGHFLVRFDDADRFVLADPFRGGESLSLDDCRKLLRRQFEGKIEFSPAMIEPIGKREILVRLLSNLRTIYLANDDCLRLEDVVRRLLAAEPGNPKHLQDLAALHFRRGDLRGAYAHLTACLRQAGQDPESKDVRGNLERLETALTSMN